MADTFGTRSYCPFKRVGLLSGGFVTDNMEHETRLGQGKCAALGFVGLTGELGSVV